MKLHTIIITALYCIFFTKEVLAHGTTGWIEESKGLLVVAAYDDEEPMSYAKIEINKPENENIFQAGHTDQNGFFMFIPDSEGTWLVAVDDGMGHKLVLEEEVAADKTLLPPKRTPVKTSKASGLLSGVGIILGTGGLLYGFQQRKKLQLIQDRHE